MARWWVVAVAGLLVSGMAATSSAQTGLLVSGSPILGTIDNNGDGPDVGDCHFGATVTNQMMPDANTKTSDLTITTSQTNMPLLRVCNGLSFLAFATKGADTSSNFADAYIHTVNGCVPATCPHSLPLFAELIDETPNPNIADPVTFSDSRDSGHVDDGARVTQGALCAGPAAQVQLPGGPTLLVQLGLFPNSMNPTHLEIPGPPGIFQLAAGGFQTFNSYIPLTADGHLTVALTTAPNDLLVDINLATLPACGGRPQGAPTMHELGLAALVLMLLSVGTLTLSRRQGFYQALAGI